MPPTPDEIAAAAAEAAAAGVQSSAVDGRSVTAMDPVRQLELADRLRDRDRLRGRSGWAGVRAAKAVPPGTSGVSCG